MKIKKWLLALLALVLVLGAGVGPAMAYFTTYTTAKGGYILTYGRETEIHEKYGERRKIISVENKETAAPVFVRVKGFSGDAFPLQYSGENWEMDEDGFWRYTLPVEGGALTGDITISISGIPEENIKDDHFNVIVVCESVPVVYTTDGKADLKTSWEIGKVEKVGGSEP